MAWPPTKYVLSDESDKLRVCDNNRQRKDMVKRGKLICNPIDFPKNMSNMSLTKLRGKVSDLRDGQVNLLGAHIEHWHDVDHNQVVPFNQNWMKTQRPELQIEQASARKYLQEPTKCPCPLSARMDNHPLVVLDDKTPICRAVLPNKTIKINFQPINWGWLPSNITFLPFSVYLYLSLVPRSLLYFYLFILFSSFITVLW